MELNNFQINHIEDNSDDNVVIKFKDLKVWTPEEKSWWRRKTVKPESIVLNNVTGYIKECEFSAVIGPSGAGKTTFLVSLAGKCTLPSTGIVTVKGRNVKELQGVVEIVPQFDVFMDNLTVMEHLTFMTEMKLGSCKKSLNKGIMNTLIKDLKLKSLAESRISSLSGGERRLLSLATSLLSNPEILICDEPTTGLDSYNASLVIGVLKKLSICGKIVICSVHQPSTDQFKEFDSILLMAEGKLLFHGTHEECKSLFESINLHCPKNYNPAEFYIRAVSSNPNSKNNHIEEILSAYINRSFECDQTSFDSHVQQTFKLTQRNWFKQVQLLLWRFSLALKRDIRNQFIQLLVSVVITSMVLGTCYAGISGTTQRGVQDLKGFLWLVTSEVSFNLSYSALYVFDSELTLFRREAGMYGSSAYFVSRLLSFIPRCVIWPITLVFIATLTVKLPNYSLTALEFMLAMIVNALAAVAYGLGMGALFTSTGAMGDVMPCADLVLFLMSGAFLRISSLPSWLYPVKYISHFYYGMDAMSNIYWRQIDHIDCDSNSTTMCVKDGASVLMEDGYSNNFIFEDTLGLLLITLLWSVIGYCGLKREEKKGFAY